MFFCPFLERTFLSQQLSFPILSSISNVFKFFLTCIFYTQTHSSWKIQGNYFHSNAIQVVIGKSIKKHQNEVDILTCMHFRSSSRVHAHNTSHHNIYILSAIHNRAEHKVQKEKKIWEIVKSFLMIFTLFCVS